MGPQSKIFQNLQEAGKCGRLDCGDIACFCDGSDAQCQGVLAAIGGHNVIWCDVLTTRKSYVPSIALSERTSPKLSRDTLRKIFFNCSVGKKDGSRNAGPKLCSQADA